MVHDRVRGDHALRYFMLQGDLMQSPHALVILDGFGYREETAYNPFFTATMPHMKEWLTTRPHAFLTASGEAVGLLPGMPGNSLVGHITLGAGRRVPQPIALLHQAIEDGSFAKNPVLCATFDLVKASGKRLHLMGLLSDGASHSHEELFHAIIRSAAATGVRNIVIHPFLDGRDAPPRSAAIYLERLDAVCRETGIGRIGTLQGRAFAMDRAEHRDIIAQAFAVLTQPSKINFTSWRELLRFFYEQDITDEHIPPETLSQDAHIQDGDALIFCNIRADRARELTQMFIAAGHPRLSIFVTAAPYGNFGLPVLCQPPIVTDGLIAQLHQHGVTCGFYAETEKAAHVTYFFGGGREEQYAGDFKCIVPSEHPEELRDHPEMAAQKITDAVITSLHTNPRDFYLINYANADMVGHTGDFDATVKALAYLDRELFRLYAEIVVKRGGTIYLMADHGKAETMYDPVARQPLTSHTTNPVPFIVLTQRTDFPQLQLKELADVAPYILSNMRLPVPIVMEHKE